MMDKDPRGIRVPMRDKRPAFMDDSDIATHVPKVGHRISIDIAEDVSPRMGKQAIAYAIERLSNEVVYRERPAIRSAVESFLHDRAWAEPIIRQAIQEAVRGIIRDMLEPQEGGGSDE